MPVHQFGLPADLEAISAVAKKYDLPILEDAACAIGSCYKDHRVGASGNMTCFSFHPRKVVSTGEGGMILTNNAEYAARGRSLINHGASVSDVTKHKERTVKGLREEEFPELGYNYRLTNLQGAMGVVQMQRLDALLSERINRAEFYNEALNDILHVIPTRIPAYTRSSYQSYVVRIADESRVSMNEAAQYLLDNGVACRPGYMACHVQPLYRQMYPNLTLPNTEKALETAMILPLFPEMRQEEQEYVVEQLAAALS
jgi:dTDP-4-amino-4,6-dideoxygalactose transaminase